jgi:outer membrane protein assembly factor BamB
MPHAASLLLCFSSLAALAASPVTSPVFWPERNGPTRDCMIPASDAARVPLHWDESKGQNIAWKVPLQGLGHSTPVIGGDFLWFTSANAEGTQQFLHCHDRHTGKELHRKLLFENADPEPLGNPLNNYAAPTAVLEEDALFVHFGTYGTARIDPKTADVVWQRRDIAVKHFRGPGSSPAVWEDLLILTFDAIDQQFVMAVDKKTGANVWKTERTTDYGDIDAATGKPKRDGDMRKAYHTPSFVPVGTSTHLVSVGSRAAFGYDPRTGKELWTVRHTGFNAAPRVQYTADRLIFSSGAESAHLLCIRIDEAMKGDITESHLLWDRPKRNCSEASPVLIGQRLFQTTRGGVVSCLDIATGKELWEERLQGQHLPSPIAAADRLYFANDRGEVNVVKAADAFEVLATNTLAGGADDACTAGMATADGALFIRTKTHLVKIAAP